MSTRRVLIVSPNFPPVNAPDMQRVRTSLPYFSEFGWQAHVLAVAPEYQNNVIEPRLLQTIPSGVPVTRTKALRVGLTRLLGFSNVGLRALPHLYRAGASIIRRERIDLVYISTTAFVTMVLGRLWQLRFGTPYVLDFQDPWAAGADTSTKLPKIRQARALNNLLEPFTMSGVGGLVAVSSSYIDALRNRYSWIQESSCLTAPFGACEADFVEARRITAETPVPSGTVEPVIRGVYAGAVSQAMQISAAILFRALRKTGARTARAANVRMRFVGTSYADPERREKAVEAKAVAEGVGDRVEEQPSRVPYFEALRMLLDSDFLIVLGSADSGYMPSKLFQYLLARRPIVAVLHEKSPAVDILRRSRAATLTTFSGPGDEERAAERLSPGLADLLDRIPMTPDTDWSVIAPFDAKALTRRQCSLFDRVVDVRSANAIPMSNSHSVMPDQPDSAEARISR